MVSQSFKESCMIVLPETNIAPENRPSQKEIHLPTTNFQGRAVSFREGNDPFPCFAFLLFATRLQPG